MGTLIGGRKKRLEFFSDLNGNIEVMSLVYVCYPSISPYPAFIDS